MLTYFILSGLANVLLSYYLIHIVEEPRVVDVAVRWGKIKFYTTTILLGCVVIPLIMLSAIFALISKK